MTPSSFNFFRFYIHSTHLDFFMPILEPSQVVHRPRVRPLRLDRHRAHPRERARRQRARETPNPHIHTLLDDLDREREDADAFAHPRQRRRRRVPRPARERRRARPPQRRARRARDVPPHRASEHRPRDPDAAQRENDRERASRGGAMRLERAHERALFAVVERGVVAVERRVDDVSRPRRATTHGGYFDAARRRVRRARVEVCARVGARWSA